jgi:hypothetical protein
MNVANLTEFGRFRVAQSLYTNGMNLAQNLRTLHMHEEAHQMEVWVLALRQEITDTMSETSEVTK